MNCQRDSEPHLLRNHQGPMLVRMCFLEFQTPEKNTKTLFWPDFVRNDVTLVRSSISLQLYWGIYLDNSSSLNASAV